MDQTREYSLFMPRSMLEHLFQQATRLDQSMSWCVEFVWTSARAGLTSHDANTPHPAAEAIYLERYRDDDTRIKQSFDLSLAIVKEMKAESARQDRSVSWTVQRAFCLGLAALVQLPSADPS